MQGRLPRILHDDLSFHVLVRRSRCDGCHTSVWSLLSSLSLSSPSLPLSPTISLSLKSISLFSLPLPPAARLPGSPAARSPGCPVRENRGIVSHSGQRHVSCPFRQRLTHVLPQHSCQSNRDAIHDVCMSWLREVWHIHPSPGVPLGVAELKHVPWWSKKFLNTLLLLCWLHSPTLDSLGSPSSSRPPDQEHDIHLLRLFLLPHGAGGSGPGSGDAIRPSYRACTKPSTRVVPKPGRLSMLAFHFGRGFGPRCRLCCATKEGSALTIGRRWNSRHCPTWRSRVWPSLCDRWRFGSRSRCSVSHISHVQVARETHRACCILSCGAVAMPTRSVFGTRPGARFRDSAVRGCSALQFATRRRFLQEVGVILGDSTASVLGRSSM